MIIYNVTTSVETGIAEEWLQWLLNSHIPEIMQTGCFSSYQVVRLLEVDETEGLTYAIQYNAESKADYNRYIQLYAVDLRNKSYQQWGQRFISFSSVMQVMQKG